MENTLRICVREASTHGRLKELSSVYRWLSPDLLTGCTFKRDTDKEEFKIKAVGCDQFE